MRGVYTSDCNKLSIRSNRAIVTVIQGWWQKGQKDRLQYVIDNTCTKPCGNVCFV